MEAAATDQAIPAATEGCIPGMVPLGLCPAFTSVTMGPPSADRSEQGQGSAMLQPGQVQLMTRLHGHLYVAIGGLPRTAAMGMGTVP